MRSTNERGFTLPELLVVILLLVGMLASTIVFMRPKSYAAANNESERQLAVATLAQALKMYKAKEGAWPPDIPAAETPIGSIEGAYDLCGYVVPWALKDLPLDPQTGVKYTGDESNPTLSNAGCNAKDVNYYTGYGIRQNGAEVTLISDPLSGKRIDLTIR